MKCKFVNIQESVILLDLLCIYVVANYSNNNSGVELHVVQFLIFVVFAYYAIFMICHCLMSTCGKLIRKKINWISILWISYTLKWKKHSKMPEASELRCDDSYNEFKSETSINYSMLLALPAAQVLA